MRCNGIQNYVTHSQSVLLGQFVIVHTYFYTFELTIIIFVLLAWDIPKNLGVPSKKILGRF